MSSATTIILHKRNPNAGIKPTTVSLSSGEIGINTADGILFTKTEDNKIKSFLNSEQLPFTLNEDLSSVVFRHGNNIVSDILNLVLGGVDNNISGAGSTIINGSDNNISSDYALIGTGSNNQILSGADLGVILGGQNNTLNHPESFILGSNISSHLSGFTYVNNLSCTGKLYGDGSQLKGIIAEGVTGPDTEVRSLTSNWQQTYTFVQSNSSTWGSPPETLKRHDFVEESNFSVSYCGLAPSGSSESSSVWSITKIIYTDFGSISTTQTANNVAWVDRLIVEY
jgi:hypothetical protein